MDANVQAALLEGLLQRYSPTLAEASAVEYLVEQMESLGFTTQIDAQGSARGSIGSGPREIVLLGHIDTVPGQIPVRMQDGILYGRGAVDAKGPLACFTLAAALAGASAGWRVTVIGAVGEEGDSRGAKQVRSDYADRPAPEYCIIGEPSSWDHITLGYKGSAWMEYTLQASLEHTAALSESACDGAVRFWNAVQAHKETFNSSRARAFEQLTTSLREMHSSTDGFLETANLKFNLRLPPDVSVDQVYGLLSEYAAGGKLQLLDGIECFKGEKNTPLVRAFLASIRAAGGKPGFLVKTGTSDMNLVGPAWRCPILAYGPGDSSLDHTANEHIILSEFLASVQILADTLRRLQEPA